MERSRGGPLARKLSITSPPTASSTTPSKMSSGRSRSSLPNRSASAARPRASQRSSMFESSEMSTTRNRPLPLFIAWMRRAAWMIRLSPWPLPLPELTGLDGSQASTPPVAVEAKPSRPISPRRNRSQLWWISEQLR